MPHSVSLRVSDLYNLTIPSGGIMEDRVEVRAVNFVRAYFEERGYEVLNVSRARGEHGGYDLLATKETERLKLEVKGCTRAFGIPDPYHTEFDPQTKLLIADILCVVYFLRDTDRPQMALIPRSAIRPEYVIPKFGYRISGRFKNARSIQPYFVQP